MRSVLYIIRKRLKTIILVLATAFPLTSFTADTDLNQLIRSSVKTGRAEVLAIHFDKQIELKIDALHVDYTTVTARHAELILGTFFRKYPAQRFEYVYQGSSGNLLYRTGSYYTGDDQYQVYVIMHRQANQQVVIHSLQFRKV